MNAITFAYYPCVGIMCIICSVSIMGQNKVIIVIWVPMSFYQKPHFETLKVINIVFNTIEIGYCKNMFHWFDRAHS